MALSTCTKSTKKHCPFHRHRGACCCANCTNCVGYRVVGPWKGLDHEQKKQCAALFKKKGALGIFWRDGHRADSHRIDDEFEFKSHLARLFREHDLSPDTMASYISSSEVYSPSPSDMCQDFAAYSFSAEDEPENLRGAFRRLSFTERSSFSVSSDEEEGEDEENVAPRHPYGTVRPFHMVDGKPVLRTGPIAARTLYAMVLANPGLEPQHDVEAVARIWTNSAENSII